MYIFEPLARIFNKSFDSVGGANHSEKAYVVLILRKEINLQRQIIDQLVCHRVREYYSNLLLTHTL